MAAPTNKCPFKVNATTNTGIACDGTGCMGYDETLETCKIMMVIQQLYDTKIEVPATTKARINNT